MKYKSVILGSVVAAATVGISHAAYMLPLAATGWENDIVYGGSDTLGFGNGVNGTVDGGVTDGQTWYGLGYNVNAPTTGLPTTVTNSQSLGADLSFQLQPFSTGGIANTKVNNAVLAGGTLGLVAPAPMVRLALIGSTGGDPRNLSVTVNFADSATAETFSLAGTTVTGIEQDWFDGTDIAYTAGGRADGNGFSIHSLNPRLYQSVFTLVNQTSAVSSVTIALLNTSGGNNAIMAISGEAVPEPTSAVLLGLGALSLMGIRRRKA